MNWGRTYKAIRLHVVELLIVIAILGILGAVFIPNIELFIVVALLGVLAVVALSKIT